MIEEALAYCGLLRQEKEKRLYYIGYFFFKLLPGQSKESLIVDNLQFRRRVYKFHRSTLPWSSLN
jgi:hypothetical protein